jgi:hypothetical protein
VLALLGGSAELARCPQFVSFSRTALPVSAAAQSLPVTASGYQPVSFHPTGNAAGVAHGSLLKASMPVEHGVAAVGRTTSKHRAAMSTPAVLRSRQRRMEAQQVRRLMVLTSWDETERPRIVFAVTEGRVISTSYAAVPTAGGWLVIQL